MEKNKLLQLVKSKVETNKTNLITPAVRDLFDDLKVEMLKVKEDGKFIQITTDKNYWNAGEFKRLVKEKSFEEFYSTNKGSRLYFNKVK